MKKAAFSLHSRTTPWLRCKSHMLHLHKPEQLRTRYARFRRLIVFDRNSLKENTAHLNVPGNDDETSKALLCAKPFKIVRSLIISFFPCEHKIVLELHILYELKN